MWIAEKLIEVSSGNRREAEDMAEDFLNDLVSTNLIQVSKRTYDGGISSCRIHDLLHSLCVVLGKESNFFHTEHNAFGNPDNVARLRRITFYSDSLMNKFFCSNPTPKKLRALFCFTKDCLIFSQMAHLDFKLLQVLVVVMSQIYHKHVTIPNKIGNMSCLRYLRLEAHEISGELPNSVVKLKHLETLDFGNIYIKFPSGVWESKQLRHLRSGSLDASNNMHSLPNILQTLMGLKGNFFQPRLLHRLTNLRKLIINGVSDSTIKMLSITTPVPTILPNALEVLKLYFFHHAREQINLSSYQNIVKLHLCDLQTMPNSSEAFPPNLVKLTLAILLVDGHHLRVLKKLPKLRILKMFRCRYNNRGKMDLSNDANGDSFPQLEVLHIQRPFWLSEVTCTDIVSMPKLNKVILESVDYPIRLSERLAKLRV